jgi:hypothetical protein
MPRMIYHEGTKPTKLNPSAHNSLWVRRGFVHLRVLRAFVVNPELKPN